MRKKAQIRMGESIAVMFVFFLLLVGGFIFYSKIERANITREKDEADDLRAIEIAQIVSFLPESQCIKENVQVYNCLDILKLEALEDITENNKLYYYDILKNSEIRIKQIYPESDASWKIYSNVKDWTKNISTQIPVSLFNATGDPENEIDPYYAFGVMYVNVFI